MPHGPWHWLEISGTGAVAHVRRSGDVQDFPDEAHSRQDYRLSLQPDLLSWADDQKTIGQIISEIPKVYAWLTYRIAGDGRVSHLCWGAPAADSNDWLAHVNVLKAISEHGGEIPEVYPAPDPKEKLRFKEHVTEALEKSAEKDSRA